MNLNGFWDDNLGLPTVDLGADTTDSGGVLDPRDAMAQGTAVTPADTSILDARDAIAQGTGTVPTVVDTGSSSDWSFKDIISTGRGVLQDLLKYKATQVPGGPTLYTRIDPRTGLPVYGGGAVTLNNSALTDNLPLLVIGGGLLVLALGGKSKRRK